METVKLLATHFIEPGSHHSIESLSPHIYIAISPGNKSDFVKKIHPNEDSCAGFICGDWIGAVIADAHWGKDAGEILVNFVVDYLVKNPFPTSQEEAEKLFCAANQQICYELCSFKNHLTSESTLMLAGIHLPSKKYIACFYGDSYCFVQQKSSFQDLSSRLKSWMGIGTYLASIEFNQATQIQESFNIPRETAQLFGALAIHRVPVKQGLKYQESALESGDILLLCSDGLIETIYGIQTIHPEELENIFQQNDRNLSKIGPILLQEALRQDRPYKSLLRGGEDNISFILLQCP